MYFPQDDFTWKKFFKQLAKGAICALFSGAVTGTIIGLIIRYE